MEILRRKKMITSTLEMGTVLRNQRINMRAAQARDKVSDNPTRHYIEEREPMLYVDVNLGSSGSPRIVVFDGDSAEALAADFAARFNLDATMREKLTIMLH